LTSNLELLSIGLGLLLSALTALVTHEKAPSWLKAVILLALSAAASVILPATQSGEFHWKPVMLTWAVTFFSGVGSHFGFLKPVGVTGDGGVLSQVGLKLGSPTPAPDNPNVGLPESEQTDTGPPDPAP
jgi:hypothetical protein